MKRKSKGFTLIEVLGTIVIITIVFGIAGTVVFNIINNSKSKSKEVAISNIEKIGKVYISEYPEEVGWVEDDSNSNKYTCVSVKSLISKGYLKEEQAIGNYIKIVKDNIGNVISNEMVDDPETCGFTVVDVPTSKDLCNNFAYGSGTAINLINKQYDVEGFVIKNYNFNDDAKTAGDYNFKLTLNDGYVWNNDSLDEKSVTCTIKKKYPTLKLEQDANVSVGEKIIELTSFDVYGDVYVKSSDLKYVTVIGTEDGEIEAGGTEKIKLNIISTRDTVTYITITVVPKTIERSDGYIDDYAKNYYTKSIMIPLTSERKNINVTYKETDGTVITACGTKNVVYGEKYGELCNPIGVGYIKPGYSFGGWYYDNELTDGNEVVATDIVNKNNNHSIYAKWIPNKIFVRYNANGGQMASTHGAGYAIDSNGFVTKNGEIYEQEFYYDAENIDLSNWNWNGKINIIKTGQKAVPGAEWIDKENGLTFNQNEGMADVTKLCDATKGNCTVTLYVNWEPNKIYVKYNTQYGTLKENSVYKLNTSNKNVLKNGSENVDIFNYGETNVNLHNYNSSTNLNIVNSNLFVPSGQEWRTSDGTKIFNQAEGAENANDLCDAKNGNCTITLFVNWHVKLTLKQYNNSSNLADDVVKTIMYKGSKVTFDLGTPKSYINSSECGTWTTLGWATSDSATASVLYNNGAKASLDKNTTLYGRYQKQVDFIYDYTANDSEKGNFKVPSRHEYMDRSASSKYNNVGPNWVETVQRYNHGADYWLTRAGYKFDGWTYNKDGTSPIIDRTQWQVGSNLDPKVNISFTCSGKEIYASWKVDATCTSSNSYCK